MLYIVYNLICKKKKEEMDLDKEIYSGFEGMKLKDI